MMFVMDERQGGLVFEPASVEVGVMRVCMLKVLCDGIVAMD